jgi:hypothetical protein
MKLRKKKTKDKDWVVINDSTGGHAHFKSKKGCNDIITLLKKGVEPYDPYFIESKRRLLEEKPDKRKKHRFKYHNVQNGSK